MKKYYSRKRAKAGQSLKVAFDGDRITLDLPRNGVTLPNGWTLIPDIYPAMVRHNDSSLAFTASLLVIGLHATEALIHQLT